MTDPPRPPGTAAQHALAGLRSAISDGTLRPGQRVGQESLAESLGVSLAPVREALASLVQEGQLTYRPRRGYFVTELDRGDLHEIYELRALLEGHAARHALPAMDEEARGRIELAEREVVEAARSGDVGAELAANRRFHFAIFEAPGQSHAMRLIRQLWDSTETYRALYYNSPTARLDTVAAHERIVAAIRAGDAERLVAELDEHRQAALRHLDESLG